MSLFGAARALASLGLEVVEALLCPPPSRHVDDLYAQARADRLADAEAEQEVTESRSEILRQMSAEAAEDDAYRTVNGFVDTRPSVSAKDLRDASYAVRVYAERFAQMATNPGWARLAERLETASQAMK